MNDSQHRRNTAIAAALAAALSGAMAPALGATKWALSIGIDDYQADSVSDLRGCVNDVQLVKGDLVGRFGFPEANVKTLIGPEATHNGIVQAIRGHLTANAGPGDVVLLHFSGHGSQMRDAEGGDEIDRLDETLVPYDSRTEGVFDLSDDEINGLLKELTAKTDHVVLWLDSCHSGSASRGGAQVRMIEKDDRSPPPEPDYAVSVRGGEGEGDMRLKGSKYVLISGCLPHQLSNEGQYDGRRHGALTWFLHEALMRAGGGASYRSVFEEAAVSVAKEYPSQSPQIEGPGQNVAVLGTADIPPGITIAILSTSGPVVKLGAGKAQLLGVGSKLDVFPPGTGTFAEIRPVARLEVTASRDFDSDARIVEGGPIPDKAKAVLVEAVYGLAPIAAYLTPNAAEALPGLRDLLAKQPGLQLVADRDAGGARLILDRVGDFIAVQAGDRQTRFPPVPLDDPDLPDRVMGQVEQVVHWLNVLGLKNLGGGLEVELDLRRIDQPEDAPTPDRVVGLRNPNPSDPANRQYGLKARVANRSRTPIYPYLLDVSSDGSIALLYPQALGAQEALGPQDMKDLMDILPFVPEGLDSVVDTFKLIATAKPIDPSIFPQGAIRGIPETRGPEPTDPLSAFLASALRAQPTRAARPLSPGGWGTAERTLTIGDPQLRHAGFAVHLAAPAPKGKISLGARAACDALSGDDCFEAVQADAEGTEWELIQRKAQRGEAEPLKTAGAAFDEAYALQDATPGATRVEPLLEAPMPADDPVLPQGAAPIARGGSEPDPDPAARSDDRWGLKMIRAEGAWRKLRKERGAPQGAEASGISIGHIDTGYRKHPEVWNETSGTNPVDPRRGRDYMDNDRDPQDPLLRGQPLDNPGHGVASGSVIVSPPGCQVQDPDGCVTGVAPGAQLIPLRVHRTVAQVSTGNMARALRDLAAGVIEGQPRIASIAMGGPPSLSLHKAVREAERKGILVVAAAGNEVGLTVWPANFDSTVAVAAVNVHCRPWSHSSFGENIDIGAPGEDVWRASVWQGKGSKLPSLGSLSGMSGSGSGGTDKETYDIWMGGGTTYATGHVSGAAALWLAYHRDNPALARLIAEGRLADAFRGALATSAWRPSRNPAGAPIGIRCTTDDWDPERYGAGILDVEALLAQPLVPAAKKPGGSDRLPLFGSLYPAGTAADKIQSDYLGLFGESRSAGALPTDPDRFETELMFHYTLRAEFRRSLDALVRGQRDLEPYAPIEATLKAADLSERLRKALGD
jgi:hypothetical protein